MKISPRQFHLREIGHTQKLLPIGNSYLHLSKIASVTAPDPFAKRQYRRRFRKKHQKFKLLPHVRKNEELY